MEEPSADAETPEARPTGPGPESLGEALLAGYPGAVVVIDWQGRPVTVNAAGRRLAETLRERNSVEFKSLVAKAIGSGSAQEGMIEIGGGDSAASIAFSIVPLAGPDPRTRSAVLIGRDVSLQENLRRALVESRKRYKDLVECSSDFGWETDTGGAFAFVSPRGALGYEAADLVGRSPRSLLPDDKPAPEVLAFECRQPVDEDELWLLRADGAGACMIVSAIPRFDDDGEWVGARGVCRDVTEARESELALEKALGRERMLADIVQAIRDEVDPTTLLETAARVTADGLAAPWCWIYRAGTDKNLIRASTYSGRFDRPLQDDVDRIVADLSRRREGFCATIGETLAMILPTSYRDRRNGVVVVARAADEPAWSDEEHSLLAGVAGQLGIAIEQIRTQETLIELSRTDDLTGLLNRRAFSEEIANRIALADRTGRPAAVLYIDLDNFKLVNDVHGHKQGDNALKMLAGELRKKTRMTDPVARLGGDEFAIWFDGVTLETARSKATSILDLNGPLRVFSGSEERPLGISIGVATFDPDLPETGEELIMRADQAMYEAKHNGKGGFVVSQAPTGKREAE